MQGILQLLPRTKPLSIQYPPRTTTNLVANEAKTFATTTETVYFTDLLVVLLAKMTGDGTKLRDNEVIISSTKSLSARKYELETRTGHTY